LDFNRIDMDGFLYLAIPTRFQDIPPYDFEDFIGHLFLDNGYIIQQTSYSGDFGADLIVEKEAVRTAVQIKRFDAKNNIGVKEINQVIAAKSYYQSDAAMLITTSDFTSSALKLSKTSDIITWNWDRLYKAISDTYFDGLNYEEYYKDIPDIKEASTDLLNLKLQGIEYEQTTEFGNDSTVIYGEIRNESDQGITVFLDLPTYLTRDRKQLLAVGWIKDGFTNGLIYPGASVEFGCIFTRRQIQNHHNKDTVILRVHCSNDIGSGILKAPMSQLKEGCFFVTFAFGPGSEEYYQMCSFRDGTLLKTKTGKCLVRVYYTISPVLLNFIPRIRIFELAVKCSLLPVLHIVRTFATRNSCSKH
jgi:hypothetical protein